MTARVIKPLVFASKIVILLLAAIIPHSAAANPFHDSVLYLNPGYAAEVQTSITKSPDKATALNKLKAIPTAIWLDTIAKVAKLNAILDDALKQQQQKTRSQKVVPVFVIYDLPGRDCHAKASLGELTLSDTDVKRYRIEFIDPIAAAFASRPELTIAAVIEPDSLPNLATNLSDPRCAKAEKIYRDSVAYAIRKLASNHVFLYLDAAHAGWLGWDDPAKRAATIFREVLDAAGGADKIRGFATNTANYTVLHKTREQYDYQGNPCHDELTYVQRLSQTLASVGITEKSFIVDTSRNGKGGIRNQWGSWCNVKGAGLGLRPTIEPTAGIDAYLWIKPPGESDGTTDRTDPHFDETCVDANATPGAPQAGEWFHEYILSLIENANPSL